MNGAYINENGILQRNRQLFPKFIIRSKRVPMFTIGFVLSILAIVTTPENDFEVSTMIPFFSPNRNSKQNISSHRASPLDFTTPSSRKRNKIGSINLSWLGFDMDIYRSKTNSDTNTNSFFESSKKGDTQFWMKQERRTNYLLYSLSKKKDGVYIDAFRTRWRLCEFDPWDEFRICETIGKS